MYCLSYFSGSHKKHFEKQALVLDTKQGRPANKLGWLTRHLGMPALFLVGLPSGFCTN
jgi:hypothetical protein